MYFEMEKVNFSSSDKIQMTMGFSKVDRENRRVVGFATLDNVDRQNDVVLPEASEMAFKRFAGNIREMHDSKKAVGRMVNFQRQTQYDPATNKTYDGILVDVFVSKGAEDTWQKVLDGTLTGFSIAGPINESSPMYKADIDKSVRVIKDYDLTELSLVDTPANQLAGIVSIVKNESGEGSHLEGLIAKADVSNVFFCEEDDVTILNKSENSNCPLCTDAMVNIGWVDKSDSENEMIKSLLAKFKSEEIKKNGGTETMADAVEKTVEADVVEKSDTAEVDEAVETNATTDEVVKSEAVEETSTEEVIEKNDSMAELTEKIEEITKSIAAMAQAVTGVADSLSEVKKSLDEQISEVSSLKESTGEVTKRLDAVEDDTAVKKSSEVGPSDDGKLEKSAENITFWGNRFVSVDTLN